MNCIMMLHHNWPLAIWMPSCYTTPPLIIVHFYTFTVIPIAVLRNLWETASQHSLPTHISLLCVLDGWRTDVRTQSRLKPCISPKSKHSTTPLNEALPSTHPFPPPIAFIPTNTPNAGFFKQRFENKPTPQPHFAPPRLRKQFLHFLIAPILRGRILQIN